MGKPFSTCRRELSRFKSLTKTHKELWITAMEEVEKEELSQKERLLPWAVMVKGQLEISRRLPKKLIAVKQKDGRDKSKTRRLLLKDLIYVIFSKRQIEPCVLKHDWSLPKEAVNRKFSVNCKHSLQSRGVKTTRSFVAYLLSENTKTIARRQLEVHAPFTFSITL